MAFLDKTGLSYVLTKIKAWVESRGYLTEHQSLDGYATVSALDDYLPLAGGDVSGVVILTKNQTNGHFKRNVNTGYLLFSGGSSVNDGAALSLSGSTRSAREGYFRLTARSSDTTSAMLEGRPDGTLTWDGVDVLTAANTAPTEIPLTDAGYAEFTALNAWRSGHVVQVYLYFRIPATAPTDWTIIATGLPAPMAQLITIANTWTASYSRPVRLSVELDGSIKVINGKANIAYCIVFSYLTAA